MGFVFPDSGCLHILLPIAFFFLCDFPWNLPYEEMSICLGISSRSLLQLLISAAKALAFVWTTRISVL